MSHANHSVPRPDGEPDSDDDHRLAQLTQPQWRLFEKTVAELVKKLDPSADVQRDIKIIGQLSGAKRQIDVLICGVLAGEAIAIAVECKRYASRLGIGAVDEFAGKLLDIDVDRGILLGLNGLTAPAMKRAEGARHPKISIGDLLTTQEHVKPDLEQLLMKFGDCPNENCVTGDVRWFWWKSDTGRIRAGCCDICGTWALECVECGDIIGFFSDDADCYSCGAVSATLVNDTDNIEPVEIRVRRPDSEELFLPTSRSAPRGDTKTR